MAIYTQVQLLSASNATYVTNASNLITAATVRTLNNDWISSSILAPMTGSMTVATASFAETASFLNTTISTASFALNAGTASYVTGSNVYGPFGSNSILSASNAQQSISSSFASSATSASFASSATSSSFAQSSISSSFASNATSASYAVTASFALNAGGGGGGGFPFTGSAVITGSLTVTGSVQTNIFAVSVASDTASIDLNQGGAFTVTLGSSVITFFNITNPSPGRTVNIIVTTGTASTASFSSNVKQPTGSLYTPSSGSGKIDILSGLADGTNLYLTYAKTMV